MEQIKTTGFGITREESDALFPNGQEAAKKLLAQWGFGEWKGKYGAIGMTGTESLYAAA